MLFGKKKSLFAPVDGEFIPLSTVKDPVFAQKMMGDGIAVIPSDGHVVSPVVGTISTIIEQKHALGITTPSGKEILLHMGIDTVALAGKPFELLVKAGDAVTVGTPLAEMDLQMVKDSGKDTTILVIVTGQEKISPKYTTATMVKKETELAKM
ncbi:PTS sugar transporter subunit IIA [Enterococcus nangangensis]|uniref:PTS sugar transporter subunit IIA n=1 Tax=Enterococcus nangangensis TaxID=2559926 RepID=UPI0010F58723|nr:PTS glucose transporter subunit IIA [Enterococcus nangangensis]